MLYILYNDNNAKPDENQRFTMLNADKYTDKIKQDFEQSHHGCYIIAIFDGCSEILSAKTQQENLFRQNCTRYGFSPDDYLAIIRTDADTRCQLIGFRPSNYKYPCQLQDIKTGRRHKATVEYVQKRIDRGD